MGSGWRIKHFYQTHQPNRKFGDSSVKDIRFGLVIQGPVTSFGNGPNNLKNGFATYPVIRENIEVFAPLVDSIVLSTWEGCGITAEQLPGKVNIIENKPIDGFDFLNQKKQFLTTQSGVDWLKKNSNCTYVLKIRTDQLVPSDLLIWLKNFYEQSKFHRANQEDFLIFSEALKAESFYAGDFIFAGTVNDLSHFCKAVLSADRPVHPMNGSDYLLKWLQSLDAKFFSSKSMVAISFLTARNSKAIQSLWDDVLKTRISLPPRNIYKKIQWRGKPMPSILEALDTAFFFNEEICGRAVSAENVRSLRKAYKLMREYWKRYLNAKREFKRKEGVE